MQTQIIKALNEELMQVTYVAMQEGVDLHGDLTTVDEIRKAHQSFAISPQRGNLFHMVMTDSFYVLESYLAPVEFEIANHTISKGTWLMTLQVNTDEVWQMIKDEEITGISICATANVAEVND